MTVKKAKASRGSVAEMEVLLRGIIPPARLPMVECFIPSALHTLMVCGGDSSRKRRHISVETQERALAKVSKAAGVLLEAMNSLHPMAAYRFRDLAALGRTIHMIKIISSAPADAFESDSVRQTDSDGLRPAQFLALDVGLIYWQMTGERPARSTTPITSKTTRAHQYQGGGYFKFLTEVFKIRGLSAGVESSAIAAIAAMAEMQVKTMEFNA